MSGRGEYTVTAAADATTRVGPLPEVVKNGRLHFLALDLIDPQGPPLDRVVTCVQADSRFRELLQVAARGGRGSGRGAKRGGRGDMYKVSVRNASTVPAVMFGWK